jgi:CRISPR-associated protein Csd1
MRKLLRSIAPQEKADNIPPNLAGDTMRAILEGTPYPATLLQAAIRRNRAEQNVTYPRAALIKASLNRALRFNNPKNEKEITMSLDLENTNIGYRLGRLFAALEKIQSDANPGINATIRDRFYGAASGSPVTVFGNLMRLSQHHLGKLSGGLRVTRERLLQEIMSEIGDFPAHLDMADQGRFAIGYYHQMQDLYTKKTDNQ